MSRRLWIAAFLVLAAACNTPAGSFPPPPVPPTQPVPLVVGHWDLEGSTTGEHLWIEADGTWSEVGAPYDVDFGALTNSSGSWTFVAPLLALSTAVASAQFAAALQGNELLLRQNSPIKSFRFRPDADPGDGGGD